MNKQNKSSDPTLPEHVPVIPFNEELELKKRKAREKAQKLRLEVGNIEAVIVTLDGETKLASELNKEEQAVEILRCGKSPIYLIETYFTIFDQMQGEGGRIVPFKLFPDQKDLIRDYQKHRFTIANKYRQAGISTTTSAFIAWYVYAHKHRNVAIVADKMETARDEMMRDVVDFLDSLPDFLKPLPTQKDSMKHKHYDNDCQIRAFACSTIRGYTPTLLFWDETAWAENGEKFWTAARPTLQTGGRAIFVSTPNGLDPVFYKYFEAARRGASNFHAIEMWWYNDPRYNTNEDGELDLEWVKNKGRTDEIRIKDENWSRKKRRELADNHWEATSSWFEDQVREYHGDTKKIAQELLCSFLGSGDNFIDEEHVKRIEEHEMRTPIRQEYLDNEMWIWEDPIPNTEYIVTVDVSAGHGDDFSSINILKIVEVVEEKEVTKGDIVKIKKVRRHIAEQVAEYYNKVTPQTLGYIVHEYAVRYNNGYVVIDVTNGYGAITIEKVLETGYENIHYAQINHKPTRDRLNGYIRVSQKTAPDGSLIKIDLIPGFFIGNNRASVLIEFQRTINMKDLIIRSLRTLNEIKTFITVSGNRVADHKRSFHDDSLISIAIGVYTLYHNLFNIKDSISKTKKMLDSIIKLSGNEVVEERKEVNPNLNTKTPDFRVSRQNPFGANSWLYSGLNKKR